MNFDLERIEMELDLEAVAWALLRKSPEIQRAFIHAILLHTDKVDVVEGVYEDAKWIILYDRGVLDG